jgi:hypothetical protein
MNLTTKNIDAGNDYVSPYVRYGVQEIKITGIEAFKTQNENWGLKITAEGHPEEKLEGKSPVMDSSFFLTERATKHTLGTLSNISETLGVKAELDAVEADNPTSYAEAMENSLELCFMEKKLKQMKKEKIIGLNHKFLCM